MIQINDDAFDEIVLASKKVVVVDFWAQWCAPCKIMNPILEELDEEYNGKVLFVKIDIEEFQQNVAKYNVKGIPTLLIFKNGVLMDRTTGMGSHAKSNLKSKIDLQLV